MATAGLTFVSKTPILCPLCEAKIFREEMRTGRGRQIAGNLTRELRRNFEPSKQYGEVYPLIYPVVVCPACLYATYPEDFSEVPEKSRDPLQTHAAKRAALVNALVDTYDFTAPRELTEGLLSYVLAASCYDFFPKAFSPVFKQGLSCLRGAWVAGDLHRKQPTENYDYLKLLLYRKARFFYSLAVEYEQTGVQPLAGARSLGPDLDKNYGYDGVLYISGLLEYEHGPRTNPEMRQKALGAAKRAIARIFGMGKASKNKPAAILDNAREVYEAIAKELGLASANPEEDTDGED